MLLFVLTFLVIIAVVLGGVVVVGPNKIAKIGSSLPGHQLKLLAHSESISAQVLCGRQLAARAALLLVSLQGVSGPLKSLIGSANG